MEGVEKEFEQNLMTSQQETKYLESDGCTKDHMIQEEIKRLCNDLCFQYLTLEYEFEKKFKEYSELKEKRLQFKISNLIKRQPVTDEDGDAKSRLEFAEKLQSLILKRQKLSQKIYGEEVKLPLIALFPEEFKENVWAKGDKAHEKDTGVSIIAGFPKTDKLYKYCKLISVSCGMTFAEVENSVDLIEQSLARTTKNSPTPL
ncbi:hypothetical protein METBISCDRAFT_24850 [Metschnikowia bicuspidata]|uniref:Uncharacterized protein n=1 Tax=Metschnikowia bicuspidata TaxID=27322 RepID=A0A4P9Z8Y1_9ASCO|nr:hypothetical protein METBISCDRAFT_24850 [Metschnikowia bicuspidata]